MKKFNFQKWLSLLPKHFLIEHCHTEKGTIYLILRHEKDK